MGAAAGDRSHLGSRIRHLFRSGLTCERGRWSLSSGTRRLHRDQRCCCQNCKRYEDGREESPAAARCKCLPEA